MKNLNDVVLPDIPAISWRKNCNMMPGDVVNRAGEWMHFCLIALYRPLDGKEIRATGEARKWTQATGERQIAYFMDNHETWEKAVQAVVEKYAEWVSLFDKMRGPEPTIFIRYPKVKR